MLTTISYHYCLLCLRGGKWTGQRRQWYTGLLSSNYWLYPPMRQRSADGNCAIIKYTIIKHVVPTNQSDCLKHLSSHAYNDSIAHLRTLGGDGHAYHSVASLLNGESTSLFTSAGCFGHGDYFMSVKLTLLFTGNQVSET